MFISYKGDVILIMLEEQREESSMRQNDLVQNEEPSYCWIWANRSAALYARGASTKLPNIGDV